MNPLKNQFKQHLKKFGYNATLNNTETIRVFMQELKDGKSLTDHKYLFAELRQVKQGDFINILGVDYMIIHEEESINNVYSKYTIRRIRFDINFIIGETVYPIPAIVDEGSVGLDENKYITLGEGKIIIYIKEDDITSQIPIGERFIKMKSAWKIISITNAEKGIYKIYADKDLFVPNDDKVNEIADADRINIDTYSVTITNTTTNLYVGDTLQINVDAMKNDMPVSNPILTFNISDNTIATVDNTGLVTGVSVGSVDITVDYEGVTDTIALNIEEVATGGSYAIEIVGDAILKQWETRTYTANVTNGGVSVSKGVTWDVSNANVSINSQDETSIEVYGETKGTVTITATLIEDNSIITTREIEVISAW
ncbi:hypothetical protein D3Z33_07055 [Senegalia massiliensis]|uniref:BIG2 domain-containing protein n=1 Tax=Senegalia massiliensis TaxID=1720316 RepID=A0A845QUQ3_9CLOT|nr:hypothetical protein [Senegalia massiliensis]